MAQVLKRASFYLLCNQVSKLLIFKETLNSDFGKLQSSKSLYGKGLVSLDDYQQAESSYYLSQLSLLQAQSQLKLALKYFNFTKDIFTLSVSDIKAISTTISKSLASEKIHILAPKAGIALLPQQSSDGGSSSSSGSSSTVDIGTQVKKSQVLVTIGLLQGLAISANAGEMDINKLKVGLKAQVTSIAFPGLTLTGSVVSIASQAQNSSSGAPTFAIKIVVPKLTPQQMKVVKMGMSVKASVKIKLPPQISVPITSVFSDPKTGATEITKLVKGKPVVVPITTGPTSAGEVVVFSGLNVGDIIVASHQAK